MSVPGMPPTLIPKSPVSRTTGRKIAATMDRVTMARFIRSADRTNLLSVNGSLVLDSQLSDLSSGAEVTDIDFLDASSVLSSQCAAARATGRTSQFSSRVTGPYAPVRPPSHEIQTKNDRQISSLRNPAPCG